MSLKSQIPGQFALSGFLVIYQVGSFRVADYAEVGDLLRRRKHHDANLKKPGPTKRAKRPMSGLLMNANEAPGRSRCNAFRTPAKAIVPVAVALAAFASGPTRRTA